VATDLATPLGIQAQKYLLSNDELKKMLDEAAQREALARGAQEQPQEGTPPQ
jgi:uncharacterized membrane protein YheB (UPF0754 family)